MTKQELSKLLHNIGCPVNEGVSSIKNEKEFPRIDYWETVWDDVVASGEEYERKVTWQVSFYAKKPRHEKLLALRDAINALGIHVQIMHEFNVEDRIWHSFFAIETDEEQL